MSSVTIVSNSNGDASLTKIDSTGFKFEKLNSKDADISVLKASNQKLLTSDPIKGSIETLDVSKTKIY